jgi:LacI family transcriptional regulator
VSRGYRRIGLAITDEQDVRVQRKWSAGYLVYQQSLKVAERIPHLLASGNFERAFTEWYREYQPDAVLTQETRCPEFLRGLAVRVPEDVGVAHLALTEADTGFAGVNQNGRLVGASAFDLVDAQLRRNERGLPASPKTVLVQGRWIEGPTVKTLPGSAGSKTIARKKRK